MFPGAPRHIHQSVFRVLPQRRGYSGTLGDLCSIRASPRPHLPAGSSGCSGREVSQPWGSFHSEVSSYQEFLKPGCLRLPITAIQHRPPPSRLTLGHPVFIRTSCQRPSPATLCLLPQSRPATFSTPQSHAGPVSILEPAQHARQAGAFAGTDFCCGDVLLGAGDDVWEPE